MDNKLIINAAFEYFEIRNDTGAEAAIPFSGYAKSPKNLIQ
jgi:hypothetical protein